MLCYIFLKQVTVSGSGISWAVCKSAPRSRQITTPAPHYSVFFRPDALPAAQPTASKRLKAPKGILRRNGVENFKGIRYRYPPHLRPFNFSAVVAAMHVSELL